MGAALWGLPRQFVVGSLIRLLWTRARVPWRVAGALIALGVFAVHLVTYHHEAVLGRFPDASVWHYATDFAGATASVTEAVSLPLAILEIGIMVALLLVTTRRLARRSPGAGDRWAWIPLVVASTFTLTTMALPALFDGSAFWGTRLPIAWLISTRSAPTDFAAVPWAPSSDKAPLLRFQRALGHRTPFASGKPGSPLCRAAPVPVVEGNGKSVILLVLESVGEAEVHAEVDGRPVMPNLAKLERENIAFEGFLAAGSKTQQAMPSLFAGQPTQSQRVLWREPLNRFAGFPGDLASVGYETAYFHGGDLSF